MGLTGLIFKCEVSEAKAEDVFDNSYCCCSNLQQKVIDFSSSLMIWDLFDTTVLLNNIIPNN